MQDPWKDFRDDPLTPDELQRTRWLLAALEAKVAALWFLWGWLATAVKDAKAWGAAVAVAGLLWGERIIEIVRSALGVGP